MNILIKDIDASDFVSLRNKHTTNNIHHKQLSEQ